MTTYNDTSVTNGQIYFYKVSAVNSVTEGALSGEKSATPSNGSVPGASTLSAASVGFFQHGIKLTWTAAAANGSPVINYRIYRGTSSGSETLLTTVGNVLTYTDTSNGSYRTSYYRVVAVNGVGAGPNSNEASAFSF